MNKLFDAGEGLLQYVGGWDLTDPTHPIVAFRDALESTKGVDRTAQLEAGLAQVRVALVDGSTERAVAAVDAALRGKDDRSPVTSEPERACPKCKDQRHLYQDGADVKWKPDTRTWEASGDYDMIECTSCDWTGTEEETEVKADVGS